MRGLRGTAVVGCLIAAVVFPVAPATAQTTYEVGVGGIYFDGAVRAELMRFYPEELLVHQNDVLRFTTDSVQGVTVLPAGADPVMWRLDNASSRDDPWAYLLGDPDDGAGATKYNARYFTPTNGDCGDEATPCEFDGAGPEPYNTGAGATGLDHSLRITAAPGATLWAISVYHQEMNLRIEVVPDTEPASDPAAVADAARAQRERDERRATTLHKRYSKKHTKQRTPSGVRWDGWAGVDSNHVSLYRMYPRRITLKKGQRVRWHFDLLQNEIHNLVFPYREAQEITFNSFQPVCDPDGDDEPGPDLPPDSGAPPYCLIPEQAEVDLDPREARERGNGVFKGGDVEASGIRGSDDDAGRDPFHEAPWDVRFAKKSKKGFRYFCTIHGQGMSGRVVVK
jgi:hypothetical protein